MSLNQELCNGGLHPLIESNTTGSTQYLSERQQHLIEMLSAKNAPGRTVLAVAPACYAWIFEKGYLILPTAVIYIRLRSLKFTPIIPPIEEDTTIIISFVRAAIVISALKNRILDKNMII